ncbi:hypothetical protein SELMODRAFT_429423 [Selaginella moellendorffii]|uniref:Myb-like domain-containing protein n=1 Tax=Selaginella moellendorffii TaxID=88036 RepID=D8T645_SELML|nr:hypothetical protein SELMODRAFT_429423 [Selaginella moellendorffii]
MKRLTLSHTLIWEILGGEWPLGEIDIHGEEWMAHLAGGTWLGAMEMERLHKGPEEPIKCHGGWSKEEHIALIRKVQEHLQRPEEKRNLSHKAVREEIEKNIQDRTGSQCSRQWRILVLMYRNLNCHFSGHPE